VRAGRLGELVALAWLVLHGYRPRARRFRAGGGEVDLVVERGGTVVFVEVKTRRGEGFGGAVAAVDARKRRRLARAAAAYLSRHGLWDRPTRFDVVTLERGWPGWRIRHLRDAFRPGTGRLL